MATATQTKNALPNGTPAAPDAAKIQVVSWKGEPPKRKKSGGKDRRPSPYDSVVERAKKSGELYLIKLPADDETRKHALKELRRAALFHEVGLNHWPVDADHDGNPPGGIVFQTKAKETEKPQTEADGTTETSSKQPAVEMSE